MINIYEILNILEKNLNNGMNDFTILYNIQKSHNIAFSLEQTFLLFLQL